MAQDIEQRREDAREASVEGVRRLEETWKLFRELEPKLVVNDEQLFRELKDRFGSPYGFGVYFRGGMGAEAIRDLLRDLDLQLEAKELRATIKTSKGQKQQRAIKRLKVVSAFITSENKPEWMVLEAVPVIPPELRPMVQLDGGRFATSDLNDLYRRVINRNNRLKRLLDLGAPEIIVNNEKRMLQEAVDALFDNGRRGRAVTGPGNRALKSLSDMLKGKQGRFRQNLLGKRVDYSGRSVIVAGPQLKLHQCGLPKLMALELFKPFIMSRLVERKSVQNIKAAKKHVESMVPEVWDVLEEVIAEHPVLLNRAPTLHRLGIQAFEPVLVEGKAIQVHPLVCHAFNADFDGDQMAVHVPLSAEAQAEARILMLSSNNILSPAHGRPLATPTQDMVLGAYYLTYCEHDLTATTAAELAKKLKLKGLQRFQSEDEVEFALDAKQVGLQEPIEYRQSGETRLTTPGRVIFGAEIERSLRDAVLGDVHEEIPVDRALTKRELDGIIDRLVGEYGPYAVASTLDTIKSLAFRYATRAGVTISKNDIVIPSNKEEILAGYEEQVATVEREYERGLMTEEERKERVTAIWTEATEEVAEAMKATLHETNPVFMMANSGARGSFNQIRQLAGMRGLMANPKGEIIERPIKANFMEGLTVLEYFISTHGARKGLADTALRTADSGYLTRRLVDVSQDVIVRDEDCGTSEFVEVPALIDGQLNPSAAGQMVAEDVRKPLKDGKPGKTVLATKGEVLSIRRVGEIVDELTEHVDEVLLPLRSVLKCRSEHGVCRLCYGTFLATGDMSEIGDAVGIVAAQSIGEPGTQLTMRTFHTGGVAGAGHHARTAACRRDLRGPQPEGGSHAGGRRRQDRGGGRRAHHQGDGRPDHARRRRRGHRPEGVLLPAAHAPARQAGRHGGVRRAAQRGLAQPVRPAGAARGGREGVDPDRAVPRRRGAEGLQVAGRRHPRQAHRADRAPDAEEGARRVGGRHRPAPGSAGGSRRAREGERGRGQVEEGRAGDVRAAHPRHHQGFARNRVVPLGRVVPGDHEGAHGRGDRGEDRPPARSEGERDHREADPGGDRSQEVPRDHDRADGAAPAADVRRRDRGRAPRCAGGDRRRRRHRPRLLRARVRRERARRRARRRRGTRARRRGVGQEPAARPSGRAPLRSLRPRFPCRRLGAVQGLLGAFVDRQRVVVRLELGDAARQRETGLMPPHGGEDACEQPLRVDADRFGKQDRELVSAGSVGDIGFAQRAAYERGGGGKHLVAAELAEPVVEPVEVVHVEHEQGQPPLVAVGTSHLPCQRVVEAAASRQTGDRVLIACGTRLAKASRGVDRRARRGRDRLDPGERVRGEAGSGVVGVCGEESQGLAVHLERHDDTRAQGAGRLLAVAVDVGDLDRTRAAPVGRAGDDLLLCLVPRHPGRADQRRAVEAGRADHRGVHTADGRDRLDRERERLVEVERAAELAERP